MHHNIELGASTQIFNALEQRAWNFNAKLQHTSWLKTPRNFNAQLQCTKAKNLEPQHKASTHLTKNLGASMQSFNALEQKTWSFNIKLQRTWQETFELQCTRAKTLELQHTWSKNVELQNKISMHWKTTKDPRASTWSFNTLDKKTWSFKTKLQCTQKTTRNLKYSTQYNFNAPNQI